MRIQHLLEQGRSRARETHYENWTVLHCRLVYIPGRNVRGVTATHGACEYARLLPRRSADGDFEEGQLRSVGLFGRRVGCRVVSRCVLDPRQRKEEMIAALETLV